MFFERPALERQIGLLRRFQPRLYQTAVEYRIGLQRWAEN